jgi:hypothetical protein
MSWLFAVNVVENVCTSAAAEQEGSVVVGEDVLFFEVVFLGGFFTGISVIDAAFGIISIIIIIVITLYRVLNTFYKH